ncbi:hypothetical protein F4780DRAFT_29015 [Xylariomycetidae sp. FL0641]|nr:hypothetical protein F4780DRAFT_29015 [Xylariomycetidae sp. FL0641]
MKFYGAASFIASAAAAAVPVSLRASEPHPPFAVAQFQAGATPHSSIGHINLSWASSPTAKMSTCTASPATYQVFPSVVQTECSAPGMSFNLTTTEDGGADLMLVYEQSTDVYVVGVHHITKEQIIWTNQQSPTGIVQTYSGPQNFTVATASEAW